MVRLGTFVDYHTSPFGAESARMMNAAQGRKGVEGGIERADAEAACTHRGPLGARERGGQARGTCGDKPGIYTAHV